MENTIKFINQQTENFKPEIGIVLGSGLGELADEFCDVGVNYSDIPNFASSTVAGHKGRLVFAEINGKKVVMMQGRIHFYEGHPLNIVTYPIKVLKALGIKTLILTNAAGAVNPEFNPADLMLITDHINFMGTNPLIGKNDDTLGVRFPDMSEIYKNDLREIAKHCAEKLNIELREGVYLATTGPSYETPAEIKAYRLLGADAVGMSTVPEAVVANYCGLNVLGISCITNQAAGVGTAKLSHSEVIESANLAKNKFKGLIKEIIANI
ncbi:MAG: purine-nucleoside phosphorylase [Fusobacterium sp.]|nr:purine-nucleoside phosphorylase [Fusobacterium sp.]